MHEVQFETKTSETIIGGGAMLHLCEVQVALLPCCLDA
jgi:hypothetical protein